MSEERIVVDAKTGGAKGQKDERFDLLPIHPLEEVARVFGMGAKKYSDDNWRLGYSWRLSYGAMMRHIMAWARGESYDEESGFHHLAHANFHLFVLQEYERLGLGTDDLADRVWPHEQRTEG